MRRESSESDLRDVLAGVIAAQATLVGLLVQHGMLPTNEAAARYADLRDRFGARGIGGTAARVILQAIRSRGAAEPAPGPSWLRGVIVGGRAANGAPEASGP